MEVLTSHHVDLEPVSVDLEPVISVQSPSTKMTHDFLSINKSSSNSTNHHPFPVIILVTPCIFQHY